MQRFFFILFLLVPSLIFAQDSGKISGKKQKKSEQLIQDTDSLNQQLMRKQAEVTSEADRVGQLVEKYGKNKGRMIADGRVWTGISGEMALDSWGEPLKKEKSVLGPVTTERWFYDGKRFLYFENGRLASWRQ